MHYRFIIIEFMYEPTELVSSLYSFTITELVHIHSDRIDINQSLFFYGGRIGQMQRQINGPEFECTSFYNCGNHSFVGVTFEELTFTKEQMNMCNNDETCLFDLAVTGDEDFAAATLESSQEDIRVQEIISE